MTDLLFVYGTLLINKNEFAAYLHNNSTMISDGSVRGLLYDIGDYPGLVTDGNDNCIVYGSLYRLRNVKQVLKQMDFYEGYGPGEDQPNLFIRRLVQVETTNGFVEAWIYLYNLPVTGLKLIKGGDYLKYLTKKSPGN